MQINRDVLPDRIVGDLSELDEDDLPGPADNGSGSQSGMTTDRSGGSKAAPTDEIPTIDNPPPMPNDRDIPVADREDGALP
jgi:hypothetical protein